MEVVNEPLVEYKIDFEKENFTDFQLKKEAFLKSLKSPTGKQKYKRYIRI